MMFWVLLLSAGAVVAAALYVLVLRQNSELPQRRSRTSGQTRRYSDLV